jgi:hypothetical protein
MSGITCIRPLVGRIVMAVHRCCKRSSHDPNVHLRNSRVFTNGVGLMRPVSGKIISLADNSVIANTTNGTFSSTVAPQ